MIKKITAYGLIFSIATIFCGSWGFGLLAIVLFYSIPTTKC